MCHYIVSGRIIYRSKSKDDILFIELCKLAKVSIYGTVMIEAYFEHINECILVIIVRISSCELVIYVFVGNMKIICSCFILIQ